VRKRFSKRKREIQQKRRKDSVCESHMRIAHTVFLSLVAVCVAVRVATCEEEKRYVRISRESTAHSSQHVLQCVLHLEPQSDGRAWLVGGSDW